MISLDVRVQFNEKKTVYQFWTKQSLSLKIIYKKKRKKDAGRFFIRNLDLQNEMTKTHALKEHLSKKFKNSLNFIYVILYLLITVIDFQT